MPQVFETIIGCERYSKILPGKTYPLMDLEIPIPLVVGDVLNVVAQGQCDNETSPGQQVLMSTGVYIGERIFEPWPFPPPGGKTYPKNDAGMAANVKNIMNMTGRNIIRDDNGQSNHHDYFVRTKWVKIDRAWPAGTRITLAMRANAGAGQELVVTRREGFIQAALFR